MDSPPPYQENLPPADNLNLDFQCGSHMPKCSKPPFGSSSFVETGLLAANHKERKVWLCPHLGMSFAQTKELFSELPVTKSAD
jgi:hypothetical protein